MCQAAILEYTTSLDVAETARCLSELAVPFYHHGFVVEAIEQAFEQVGPSCWELGSSSSALSVCSLGCCTTRQLCSVHSAPLLELSFTDTRGRSFLMRGRSPTLTASLRFWAP